LPAEGGSTGLKASIVVPVHNEAVLLEGNTRVLVEYLDGALDGYEVILVENGSLDDTAAKARNIADGSGNIRVLEMGEPSLGGALKAGTDGARYDRVVYFPMDLSAELGFIPESVRLLDAYDVVVGSKRSMPHLDGRPLTRRLLSVGYHLLVRCLFGTRLTDTTCVKAIRRSRVQPLLAEVPSTSSVFETELLMAVEREGLRIRELPVAVRDDRPSRQPLLVKVTSKLRDLASLRVHVFAFGVGGAALISGLALLGYLVLEKVRSGQPGFLNPYSFLIAMLLVVSGFQMLVFGLLANLLLQVRRTVEAHYSSPLRVEDGEQG
jgi:glycosyltransferase involved in cell wall biosynthesis